MTPERKVAVVTDEGCSIRPHDSLAQKYGVAIMPLELSFYQDGVYVPCTDPKMTLPEFYKRLREAKKPPKTSGAMGSLAESYKSLATQTDSIISIHLTSKRSGAWSSAVLAKRLAQEEMPELLIEVIDSKQISLGQWFLVERAAQRAQEGASLAEIKQEVIDTIPKIELLAVLANLDNVIAGGRVPAFQGHLGNLLKIKPILAVEDGEIQVRERPRSMRKAIEGMVEWVRIAQARQIVKMAVLHTNDLAAAKDVRSALADFYHGEIKIYDAGKVLAVHAGEGAVGVAFETKRA